MSPSVSVRLLLTQSDARLVAFAQAGHERAYEALVKRYRRPLLGYCRRLLLSEERAEDALQQALLQAWLALREGTEVSDVKPWLYRIVHNSALNVLRASGYDYYKLSESLSGADAPQADLDRRIAVREALAGLAALPEMQREALLRTAVEGHTHQQVARELGLSENALRGLVYRARATMRAAAGALTPSPLVSWALASGGRGTSAVERLAEIGTGGGSVGLTGLLIKGGAVAVTAGVLAGGTVAGHPRLHATAEHSRSHAARRAHSASRPIAVRTVPPGTVAAAAHTQHEQQAAHDRRRTARQGVLPPRHVTRQPSSVAPATVTVVPAPIPVRSNDPKSKSHQGSSGGSRGGGGKTPHGDSNGPGASEGATGGHDATDHGDGRGQQSPNGSGKETASHSGKGGGFPDESRSGSGDGNRSENGSGRSSESSGGSFSTDRKDGGSSGSSPNDASPNTGQPGESQDHQDSPEMSPSTGTNSSSKDEHGSFPKG